MGVPSLSLSLSLGPGAQIETLFTPMRLFFQYLQLGLGFRV